MNVDTLHLIAQAGIVAGVFTAMLAMGLSVPFGEIVASLRDARTLLLALAANFIAAPLLALGLVRILPLDGEGHGAVLLGATAGAPFLPKLAELAKGHVPFSIGLMVVLMAVTVGYAPLVLPFLLPDVNVSSADIAKSLLALMLLPLALGLLLRSRYALTAPWALELERVSGGELGGRFGGRTAGRLARAGNYAGGALDPDRRGAVGTRRCLHRLDRRHLGRAGPAAGGGAGHGDAQLRRRCWSPARTLAPTRWR